MTISKEPKENLHPAQSECLRSKLHLFLCRKQDSAATLTTALNKGTPKICFIIRRGRLAARKCRKHWSAGGAPGHSPFAASAPLQRGAAVPSAVLCCLASGLHTPVCSC